jgi:signal transduction histidine kinase
MPRTGTELGHLNILLVGDALDDYERMSRHILDAGVEATFERACKASTLRDALRERTPDIVLCDLSAPGFTGTEALRIVRASHPDLPFILVSGTTGEENAVAALREGANDYILKHQPARLPSAVARAVRDARGALDRQRVEAELMRAQRLESLSLLAAGLSHDLRNILQPLLIMPELLKARTDDPQLRHLADVIAECGRRGHEMAESMLSFVRGSRTPSEPIRVAMLFEAVALLLRSNLPPQITLQLAVDPPELAVQGNYTELQQVLLNLALNAIQAMPEGGRLALQARADVGRRGREWLRISVSDEGIGMGPETLARLFNPFFTTKPNGTGLGLMSCKRIIEGAQGQIEVDSAIGKGSRFDLLLPLGASADDSTPTEQPPALGSGQSILVVDGEATRLSLLGNALSSQGYHLQLASDGAAALRWMQQEAMPALVIADAGSKLLSASSLLREMAALGYHGPVLVLENEDVPVRRSRFPATVQVHVLRKPLEMQQVFRSVAEALSV